RQAMADRADDAALSNRAAHPDQPNHGAAADAGAAVARAARAYAESFADQRDAIGAIEGDDEDEPRMVEGTVTLTAMTLPSDAVLRSSVEAMSALWPGAARAAGPAVPTN